MLMKVKHLPSSMSIADGFVAKLMFVPTKTDEYNRRKWEEKTKLGEISPYGTVMVYYHYSNPVLRLYNFGRKLDLN